MHTEGTLPDNCAMFTPSQADVRRFFCSVHTKGQRGEPMVAIETLAHEWILRHPEFHAELSDVDAALQRMQAHADHGQLADRRFRERCQHRRRHPRGRTLTLGAAGLVHRDAVAALGQAVGQQTPHQARTEHDAVGGRGVHDVS